MGKWYVVWSGKVPGVYSTWDECRTQIHGVKGAKYKSFKDISKEEAERIFREENVWEKVSKPVVLTPNALAVDAACSGNPGPMEYRGVVVETGDEVFKSTLYPIGTNNMGEFLAIIHALALMEQRGNLQPVYSDSMTALTWVREGKCNSKLPRNASTELLWQHIKRAEKWLATHPISRYELYKWDTQKLGEIPADFGRKK